MIFVIGNGKSRQNVNLNILKERGKILGCNALFRDFTPDILFNQDSHTFHEIVSNEYPKKNQVFVREIDLIHESMYETLVYEIYNNENFLENDKKNAEQFYMHSAEFGHLTDSNIMNYVTWIPNDYKINVAPWVKKNSIDFDQSNSGFCACRLAYELYPREEIYMIGFDIFGNRNNIYDGTHGYYDPSTPHHMQEQWLSIFNQLPTLYPDINITRVINDGPELEKIPSISYEELCQRTQINQKILITSTQ